MLTIPFSWANYPLLLTSAQKERFGLRPEELYVARWLGAARQAIEIKYYHEVRAGEPLITHTNFFPLLDQYEVYRVQGVYDDGTEQSYEAEVLARDENEARENIQRVCALANEDPEEEDDALVTRLDPYDLDVTWLSNPDGIILRDQAREHLRVGLSYLVQLPTADSSPERELIQAIEQFLAQ